MALALLKRIVQIGILAVVLVQNGANSSTTTPDTSLPSSSTILPSPSSGTITSPGTTITSAQPTTTTLSLPAAGSSTTVHTTDLDNGTSTVPAVPTKTALVPNRCLNGSCFGNSSYCLNETTITSTCVLSGNQQCYQIVFENDTAVHYEVGCKANCEYLVEEAKSTVTMTTRCCYTNMCNNKLLSDPDKSAAVTIETYTFMITLFLFLR